MNKFYVYLYLDPRKPGSYVYNSLIFDFEPFYVGKGSGYRCFVGIKDDKNYLLRLKHNKIKKIFKDGYFPIVLKLYENLSEEQSLNIEKEVIKSIGRIIDKSGPLVNITDGGEGMSGYKHSEEWKAKVSKPVIQYDKFLNLVNEYPSIKEASIATNIHKQNINACVTKKYKTAGGFIWRYKNDYHLSDKISNRKKHRDETIKKIGISNSKSILQYSIDGKLIKEWKSLKEAAEYYKTSYTSISSCCRGVYKTSRGFIWRYKDDKNIDVNVKKYKVVIQYDKNENFIKEWISAKEIEDNLGFNPIIIRSCCSGKNKSYKGFIWKYKE